MEIIINKLKVMNIMKKKYLEFLAIYFVTRVYDIIVDKLK